MGRKGEKWGKVSRYEGNVRLEKVPTRRWCRRGRRRCEERAKGDEKSRSEETVSIDKGRGEKEGRGQEAGRGEGPARDEPIAEDPGKGRVHKVQVEEQGRGQERKQSEEQAWSTKLGPGGEPEKGRGPERGETRYSPQPLGRPRARRKGQYREKCGGEDGVEDRFFEQVPMDTVGKVFQTLVDSPIDPKEEYLGFPYYLKISYLCNQKVSGCRRDRFIL
ncbi:hypothetical protein P7K49_034250 [Saguinus oedipus]|uniref:CATSPERG N-terminal domain-containing protein n=1 Tax=Saguinus oedipus TaxID=9490 RepID=A0ABQ9TVA9_SAGOE|nr:hypothetical protein P7K49_034250 [Saguinus oedipus]